MNDRRKESRDVKNSIGRAFFAALALVLQIGWIVSLLNRAGTSFPYVQFATELLALVVAVVIINQRRSAASKNLWILLVLTFPVLGLILYLLVGQPWATHTMRKRYESIDRSFVRRMEAQGIQCRAFNPILPIASAFMNNRDHRKITVIDGRVGFTGGYNLADEYFNRTHPYGHWKDTGVLLRGDAVRSLTMMFLEMWNAVKRMDADFQRYICTDQDQNLSDGYVQPYADSPLDEERVGENVYMNVLKNARRYCWITTPYLILDDEMTQELTLAAKRGVDVRIITPGIPDKKLVFQLTRSYYAQLARCGVRIFEYAPGFMHAKQMLCDDSTAVVGTINLDYRSLYLHFEDAVLMYRCSAVRDVRSDFEATFPKCREMTDSYGQGRRMHTRIVQSLLRLLAPLL